MLIRYAIIINDISAPHMWKITELHKYALIAIASILNKLCFKTYTHIHTLHARHTFATLSRSHKSIRFQ